jgi:hypothetical protein
VADWIHWLRIYTATVTVLVAIAGTFQVKRLIQFLPENQMAWLSLAVLNFAIGFGTVEALLDGVQGGDRTGVIAGAVTLELAAVLWRPVHNLIRWRAARRLIRHGK